MALKERKHIIPMLLKGFEMPAASELPEPLQPLTAINAPKFDLVFFDAYIDKLMSKGQLRSEPVNANVGHSAFKFYSNEDCKVYEGKKLIATIKGQSEEPFYAFMSKKGQYRFRCINDLSLQSQTLDAYIDIQEEKIIDILWHHKSEPLKCHSEENTTYTNRDCNNKLNAAYPLIDLGLKSGLRWSACNIGANSPYESGNYYAWGEIHEKKEYWEENSENYNKSFTELRQLRICNKTGKLTPSYDIATKSSNLIRIPTKEECAELIEQCTWTTIFIDNRKFYQATGPNGNTLVFPAAGDCYGAKHYDQGEDGNYWTSSVEKEEINKAYDLLLTDEGASIGKDNRAYGRTIRPVSNE